MAESELGHVPIGGCVPFDGEVTSLPTNWAVCDGTLGTPDLRFLFLRGVDATHPRGTTGGANTHVHDDHPALAHAGAAVADHAAQSHVGSAVDAHAALATHQHEIPFQLASATIIRPIDAATFGTGTSRAATATATITAATTAAAVALTQAVSGGTPNAHAVTQPNDHPILAHGVTQPNDHAAQSHVATSNEPPYYCLVWIRRMS